MTSSVGTWALDAGSALVGSGLERQTHIRIAVEGDKLTYVGPASGAPDVHHVVDAAELTVIPGFIDAHVHIGFYDPRDVLRGGVTTVRDLAWPVDEIFEVVQRSQDPQRGWPAVIAAGPMLTIAGGYPTRAAWAPAGTGLVLGDPDQATEAVARLAQRGAAVIKVGLNAAVGPTMPPEMLSAVVAAAHRHDLKVTAHVTGLAELEKAIAAGLDELAHMLMSPEEIPDELLDAMVDQGMRVVPTLAVFAGEGLAIAVRNLSRFLERGGEVVYGTDLGNEGPRPGIDPLEVARMAAAGLDSYAIIRAATADSAGWLGLGDRGVLEQGRRADLVGIRGDLTGPPARCLTNVELVVAAGNVVELGNS